MVSVGSEFNDEFDKFYKMSSHERLVHLRNYAKFCKQMKEVGNISSEEILDRILILTKGYE